MRVSASFLAMPVSFSQVGVKFGKGGFMVWILMRKGGNGFADPVVDVSAGGRGWGFRSLSGGLFPAKLDAKAQSKGNACDNEKG